MADFEYVDWVRRAPLTSARFHQMSENDQHLKDLVDAMPKGIIGWTRRTSDRSMANQEVGATEWVTMSGFDVEVEVEENRLFKATYKCRGVYGGNAAGIRTVGARILVDGSTSFGAVRFQVEQNYTRGFDPIFHVGTLAAGTHTFTVQHAVIAGKAADGKAPNVTFQATATSPHQLVVEDLGSYIANQ